jgi:hypothetical protein
MQAMRIVPTRIHAFLDYPLGVFLIAAPWIFGFAGESAAAKWISIIVGVAILAMSSMTDYELGLMRVVPMSLHNLTDVVVGIFFAVSPWLFGFADEGANAWLPFVVVGIAAIGAGAMTENAPRERTRARTANA